MIKKIWDKILSRKKPFDGMDYNDVIWLSEEFMRKGGPYAYYNLHTKKKLIVKVPPGIEAGQRIRLKGLGQQGKRGGKNGDLYLNVGIRQGFLEKVKNFFAKK